MSWVCAAALSSASSWAADGPSKTTKAPAQATKVNAKSAQAPISTRRARLFADKITKMRPKGWTLDRGSKPAGLGATLLGPRRPNGRAVLTVRPWDRAAQIPEAPAGRAALAKVLGVQTPSLKVSAGPNGLTIADLPPREGVQVRYFVHRQGLLTLGAPPDVLPKASAWVMKALARLP